MSPEVLLLHIAVAVLICSLLSYSLHLEVSLPRLGFSLGQLELLLLMIKPCLELEQLRRYINAPFLNVVSGPATMVRHVYGTVQVRCGGRNAH